jgi:hypothetical protein
MFSEEQKDYMKKLGLNFNFNKLSDDEWIEIEEKIADRLQYAGFDFNYNITEEGKMCESILDMLP